MHGRTCRDHFGIWRVGQGQARQCGRDGRAGRPASRAPRNARDCSWRSWRGITRTPSSWSARRRWRICPRAPTMPSLSATRSPASSRSRRPAKAAIRADSRTSTTRSSGRSSRRCPTSSIPTATGSRCGRTASSRRRWRSTAISRSQARSSPLPHPCSGCSRTSSHGQPIAPRTCQTTRGYRRAPVPLAARGGGRGAGAQQPRPRLAVE